MPAGPSRFPSTDEAPVTKKGLSVYVLFLPVLCGSLEAGAQEGTGLLQATGTQQCAPKPHLLSESDLGISDLHVQGLKREHRLYK